VLHVIPFYATEEARPRAHGLEIAAVGRILVL
jgi:hypothetical protein